MLMMNVKGFTYGPDVYMTCQILGMISPMPSAKFRRSEKRQKRVQNASEGFPISERVLPLSFLASRSSSVEIAISITYIVPQEQG